MKIPGVYVEIKGDTAQLKQDISQAKQLITEQAKGMSEALNNALSSGQIKSSITSLTTNLGTLARSAHLTDEAFDKLGVELGELRSITKMTDADFKKLQSQMLNTQASKAQENSLRSIARSANLTEKEIKSLGRQFGLTKTQIDNVTGSAKRFGAEGKRSGELFGSGFLAASAKVYVVSQAIASAYRAIDKLFFKFNATIEISQLGIASAFLTAGKYIDVANGKALDGHAAMMAAQAEAASVVEELKAANLETIATLDQLVRAYQETLPNAMRAGFDKSQVQQFTTAMIQAAGAIDASGALMHQLGEETRSILTGTINPRTSRIATVLGITNDDLKEFKGDADAMFNFLMGKLSAYKEAGVILQSTWSGLTSNVIDIASQISGLIGEPIFETVKVELKDIIDSLVVVDEKTKQMKWSDDFMSGAKDIKDGITSIIAETYRLSMLVDKVGGTLSALGTIVTFGDWDKKLREWNTLMESRYAEGDRKLQELANRQEGLNSDGSSKQTTSGSVFKANSPKIDTSDIDKEAEKEAKKATKIYEKNLKEQADLRADLTQKVKELTLSENDYKHWMLDVELADMRTHAQGQKDILDQIETYAKAKNVQLNIEFNEDIDDALKDFFDDIDKLGDKSVETADDIKDAFSGWASNMASDMNDVLWGAELTFDSMAESFGKMITQMIIQKSVLEPIMGGLFGDGTSGSTGLLSGIFDGFHSGGIVGSDSPTFTRALPRFHSGGIIGSDEVPAILQKGEGVFTAGQMAALGSGSGGNTNINIINNTSGSVTTSEKPNSSGGMDLEIIIDQLVAKKMNSAGSATQKAMYSTTGASRQLTRR